MKQNLEFRNKFSLPRTRQKWMASKKKENIMAQVLEDQPHYKAGTKVTTGEKGGKELQVRLRKMTETQLRKGAVRPR